MSSLRYLNTVLTVLTVLVGLHLWTVWSGGNADSAMMLTQTAHAQSRGGVPDAGAQRLEMISLLKQLVKQSEDTQSLLKSGQVRVKLEGESADKGNMDR